MGHTKTRLPELPGAVVEAIKEWERLRKVSVLSNDVGRLALKKLFWSGCDPLTILDLVGCYATVGLNVKRGRRVAKGVLSRVHKLSRRLAEDAKEVRAVDKSLELNLKFPDEMEQLAEYLSGKGLYTEEMRATILSRGAGLQAELSDAVRFVQMTTGRPHYRELADLVHVLSGNSEVADDLRKKVENFRTRLHDGRSMFSSGRSTKELKALVDDGKAKWGMLRETLRQTRRKP